MCGSAASRISTELTGEWSCTWARHADRWSWRRRWPCPGSILGLAGPADGRHLGDRHHRGERPVRREHQQQDHRRSLPGSDGGRGQHHRRLDQDQVQRRHRLRLQPVPQGWRCPARRHDRRRPGSPPPTSTCARAPGSRTARSRSLPDNTTVTLTGKAARGYTEVSNGSSTGWIATQYLGRPSGLPAVTGTRVATADLLIRTTSGADYKVVGEIAKGKTVSITGTTQNGRAQIIYGNAIRWVTAKYLTTPVTQPDRSRRGCPRSPAPGTRPPP